MAFGISSGSAKAGQQSYNKNYTTETAYMIDKSGKKIAAHTHGAEVEIQEEFYVTPSDSFTNTATGGQEGTNVTTNCTLTESNQDYAKYTVTKKALPDDSLYTGGSSN